jgi:hypothetical protein
MLTLAQLAQLIDPAGDVTPSLPLIVGRQRANDVSTLEVNVADVREAIAHMRIALRAAEKVLDGPGVPGVPEVVPEPAPRPRQSVATLQELGSYLASWQGLKKSPAVPSKVETRR